MVEAMTRLEEPSPKDMPEKTIDETHKKKVAAGGFLASIMPP